MICEGSNLILSVFNIILKINNEKCKEYSRTVNTLHLEWLFLKSKKKNILGGLIVRFNYILD